MNTLKPMSVTEPAPENRYTTQHKKRLSWMPWLYYRLKPKHRVWATPWQEEIQQALQTLETVRLGEMCFISPDSAIFAEPGRPITMGNHSFVAAGTFLHGPISIGHEVAINHSCSLDGGKQGIHIGDRTRIANQCKIYAFDHGMSPAQPIYQQANTSEGIYIGQDVWIGAGAGIRDGVRIGDHAVVGMNSMVTKDVPDYAIVAGNPARIIGNRQDKPEGYIQQLTGIDER